MRDELFGIRYYSKIPALTLHISHNWLDSIAVERDFFNHDSDNLNFGTSPIKVDFIYLMEE